MVRSGPAETQFTRIAEMQVLIDHLNAERKR
jgi:hypothetical protein